MRTASETSTPSPTRAVAPLAASSTLSVRAVRENRLPGHELERDRLERRAARVRHVIVALRERDR